MKTTERFENAVTKLYKAFHEGTLNAFDCQHCAVGNIVGHGKWNGCTYNNMFYSETNYLKVEKNTIMFYNEKKHKNSSGYSADELTNIEYVFLKQWETFKSDNADNTNIQFKGLCAVIEYLASLDNIPNPMDYSKLFETENEKPKYELTF